MRKLAVSFFYENLQIEPRLIEKILSSRDSGPIEFTSEKAEEEKLTKGEVCLFKTHIFMLFSENSEEKN